MADSFTLSASIEVDGTPLGDQYIPLLEHVTVDDYLHMPDMFVLRFRDIEASLLGAAKLKIGAKLKISGTALGSQKPEPLIEGEITAVEGEYGPRGNKAIVRGYDLSHRLHRGRHTETYKNMKDSDIAKVVAGRAGLQLGQVDDTGATHPHVSQANISDWEFLAGRAQEIGFELVIRDGKFRFAKPTDSAQAPADGDFATQDATKLVMGQELLEFTPRVTLAGQVKEVEVRGWDPKAKQAVVGKAAAKTTSAKLTATPASLAGALSGKAPVHVQVDKPMSTQRDVQAAAEALADKIGSAFAEAEGIARGNPKLKAGTAVSISVVSAEFTGQYTLTQTRHDFDSRGYFTRFTVSGRHERSLRGLVTASGGNGTGAGGSAINGVVVAIVTNNNDDELKLGRVKLKFPWLSEQYESDWARMIQLSAGPNSGALFMPEVGDEVLVAFEFGDIRRPYVVGGLYNGKDKPNLGSKELFKNGKVARRGIVSRKGHKVVLFDDDSQSGIGFVSASNKLRLSLNETKSKIRVYSDGTVEIEAKGDITIKSSAGISIEAASQLKLQGSGGVKISSNGVVDIDGTAIQLN